jgi:L-rhamnose mutarotase
MNQIQFRRFAYFITSEDIDVSKIFRYIKLDSIQKKLKEVGIFSFEAYQKEQDYFLLIDAHLDMSSSKVSSALLKVDINFNRFLLTENKEFFLESSPLERIYKFEQQKVYKAKEGQLKTDIGEKKRFVWTLLLDEDPALLAEYKRVHNMGQAWPEITANMKSVGVKDMEIYIHKEQIMLIMDAIPNFNLDEVGPKWQKLPREEEWQAYVAKFQRTDSNSSIREKWKDMIAL